MKNFRPHQLAIVFALLSLTSCNIFSSKKAPKHIHYIDKEAVFVVTFDLKKMLTKSLDLDDIFTFDFIPVDADGNDQMQKKMLAIKDSGLDILNKSYMVGMEKIDMDNHEGLYLIVPMQSFKTFRKFLSEKNSEINKPALEVKEGETKEKDGEPYSYVQMTKEGLTIGFNKEVAIIMITNTKSLENLKYLFSLKKGDGLFRKDDNFSKSTDIIADITFWTSLHSLADQHGIDIHHFTDKNLSFIGTYFTGYLNFKEGMIEMDGKLSFSQELREIVFNTSSKTGIRQQIIKDFAIKDPKALISVSLNLEGIKKEIHDNGDIAIAVNQYLSKYSTNTQEIVDIFSGEIILGIRSVEDSTPEGLLTLGVKNHQKLEKMVKKADKYKAIRKTKNGIYEIMGGYAYMIESKDALHVTLTGDIKTDVLKKRNIIQPGFQGEMTKSISHFYLDYSFLEESKLNPLTAHHIRHLPDAKAVPFNSVVINAMPMVNEEAEFQVIIKMNDPKNNALKSLLSFYNQ